VTVWVSDQDRAREFYVEKLGFELQSDESYGEQSRWLEVVPPGADTALTLVKPHDRSHPDPGGAAHIVFEADDIDATYEELKSRGVEFTQPPEKQEWGRTMALFADPDGNAFVLVGAERD
jgi:catechol 2,3-dioxygenase-like lactoylglutathione lyase family enzyme